MARRTAEEALSKKAGNVVILCLRDLSPMTDYFVICDGSSDIHVRAIADHICEVLKERGVTPWHVEGREHAHWILIDYIDVVVHVFLEEPRLFYGLERLWGDAPTEVISAEIEEVGGEG